MMMMMVMMMMTKSSSLLLEITQFNFNASLDKLPQCALHSVSVSPSAACTFVEQKIASSLN